MSCLYLHEICFHISHGLIDSLIRYSVFKVQTANVKFAWASRTMNNATCLKQFGVGLVGRTYFVTGIRPPLPVMSRFACASTLIVSRHEDHCSLLSWRLRDSNSRPPACKAGALPTELSPQISGNHLLSHIVSNIVSSAA